MGTGGLCGYLDIVRLSLSAVIKIWEEFRGPRLDYSIVASTYVLFFICCAGCKVVMLWCYMGAGGHADMLGGGRRWACRQSKIKNNPESSGHCRPGPLLPYRIYCTIA